MESLLTIIDGFPSHPDHGDSFGCGATQDTLQSVSAPINCLQGNPESVCLQFHSSLSPVLIHRGPTLREHCILGKQPRTRNILTFLHLRNYKDPSFPTLLKRSLLESLVYKLCGKNRYRSSDLLFFIPEITSCTLSSLINLTFDNLSIPESSFLFSSQVSELWIILQFKQVPGLESSTGR